MTLTAFVMGIAGIVLSFMPSEVLNYFSPGTVSNFHVLTMQITGALYFAFGMVNHTARANLIGGIYGRPIAIGNLTHFLIGSLVLVKALLSAWTIMLLIPAAVYVLLAICFAIIFFRHPLGPERKPSTP